MNRTIMATPAPRADGLWIYAILAPVLLNLMGVVVYGGYYALTASAPAGATRLPMGYVTLFSTALILSLEWVLVLTIRVRLRQEGSSLRALIAPADARGQFRWPPALGVFLAWNSLFAIYLGLASILYGNLAQSYSGLPLVLRLVLLVVQPISAGFTEELIWRGYVLTRLEARGYSARAVIGLSALSFAAIHGIYLPDKLLATFILGVIAAWYYRRTRNLVPLMVTHAVLDFWSVGLLLTIPA